MSEKGDPKDLARRSAQTRRRRDVLALLPLLGVFLFLSPVVSIFNVEATIFGLPIIFLFVYGAWLAIILLARWISRRADQGEGGRE